MQYDFKIQNLLFKHVVVSIGTRLRSNVFGNTYNIDNDGVRYTKPQNYANLLSIYADASIFLYPRKAERFIVSLFEKSQFQPFSIRCSPINFQSQE